MHEGEGLSELMSRSGRGRKGGKHRPQSSQGSQEHGRLSRPNSSSWIQEAAIRRRSIDEGERVSSVPLQVAKAPHMVCCAVMLESEVITGSYDRTVRRWHLETGETSSVFRGTDKIACGILCT